MNHPYVSRRALRRAGVLSTALAGSLALAAATVGVASAAAGAATPAPGLEKPTVHPEDASASPYLSGYQLTPSGGLASASATFTVPKATCTPAQKSSGAEYWAGVYTDSLSTYAFINSSCTTGATSYSFVFSTPAGSFTETGDANAGDVVVTSLFQTSSETEAEIHDLTNNEYWVAADPTNVGDTVIDVGTYDESEFGVSLPKFAPFTLSNATVNGDYLGFDGPTQVNAVDGGTVLVKTGKLKTTATGSSFTQTFEKSL